MLEELGIPIVTTQGRYGGYQVVPGFKLPPMIFSDEEALALAVGLMAARGLGLAQSMPALASARAKLERVFPAKLKSRLRAVDESVAVDSTRSAAVIDQEVLGLLCSATQDRHRVRMAYQSQKNEQTEREFDPYGLVYRAGRWYIVGWCHLRRGLRSFRLDRVVSASSSAVRFERPADFDALAYLRQSIATIPRAHAVEVLFETDLATAQKWLVPYVGVLECVDAGCCCAPRRTTSTGSRTSWRGCRSNSASVRRRLARRNREDQQRAGAPRPSLDLRPHPQQVVIVPGQRHGLLALAVFGAHLLDGLVEAEQVLAMPLVRHHALRPEERRGAAAARHRVHAVQAARGVQHQVARG
jgi:hypothetical protein